MKYGLRVSFPLVLAALSTIAWAVLNGHLAVNSIWVFIVLGLTMAWILPGSVYLDRNYRAGEANGWESFSFKLVCYTFGVPLVVMWVNALLNYIILR